MKNTILTIAGAVAILALAQTTQATPSLGNITGAIGFAGNADLNTGTAATATTVVSWNGAFTPNPVVQSVSGVVATIVPAQTQIVFAAPWNFTTSSTITPFWYVLGTPSINFQLLNTSFVRGTLNGNAYTVISGTGLLSATGYTSTDWSFSVTFQDPSTDPTQSEFTFSASQNSVPDGGTTVMLLGAALSGMALIKRKFMA